MQAIYTFNSSCHQIIEHDIHTIYYEKGDKYFGLDLTLTSLIPLERDPESAHGGVTAWVISHVYEAWLPELVGPDDIFMHNSASVYTAHLVRHVLDDMGIEVMI